MELFSIRIQRTFQLVSTHLVRFPRGWNLRWPELYAHLTTYRRKFRANRWHDAADVVTGIVEREAAGRGQKRVRGIRFL